MPERIIQMKYISYLSCTNHNKNKYILSIYMQNNEMKMCVYFSPNSYFKSTRMWLRVFNWLEKRLIKVDFLELWWWHAVDSLFNFQPISSVSTRFLKHNNDNLWYKLYSTMRNSCIFLSQNNIHPDF